MGSRVLRWGFLGQVPYREAVTLQEELRERLRRGEGEEHLLLLEHPHVFTLGRNASRSDLVGGADWMAVRGVEVEECDRGGQVTYHGPGQLVGYPILDLNPDRRDLRRYVRDLMDVLVRTLSVFGVRARSAGEGDDIGVWVGEAKVASIGVHVSRWLTTHGFALNVGTDLSYFSGIVACGLPGVSICSIESVTGSRPELEEVAAECARVFAEVFGRDLQPMVERPACPTAS